MSKEFVRISGHEHEGEVLRVGDFYGLDYPQYVTLVNNVRTKVLDIFIEREEGHCLLDYCSGTQKYNTGRGMVEVLPGDFEYLDAVKQNTDCLELTIVDERGATKKITLLSSIERSR